MSDGRAVRGVDSCNSQTLLSRVRVRLTARADTCLGWDAWHHPVIRANRRLTKDPFGQNTMKRCTLFGPVLGLCGDLGSIGDEQHHEEIAHGTYVPIT